MQRPPPNWTLPLQSIGSLHADADHDFVPDRVGSEVLVAGRVSAGTGMVRADIGEIYLQDGTGGIRLMMAPGSAPLFSGDSVLVHGRAGFRYGMLEIAAPSVRVVKVESRNVVAIQLPNRRRSGGGEGPDLEGHEGELVEVLGRVAQVDSVASGRLFIMLAGTSLVQVFTYTLRSQPVAFKVSVGDYVRVRGVAIQQDFQPPFNGSYVVYPLSSGDVRLAGIRPATVRNTALAVGALFLLALLWAGLLRRQVRRRTKALVLSEARYGHLFDAAADPVFVFDAERGGEITEANRAAQRGFGITADGERPDGVRARFSDLIADEAMAEEHLRTANESGRALGVFELCDAKGRAVPFELATRKLAIGEGASLVSIARNVEERREYELGLLQAMSAAEDARVAAEDARRAAEEAMRLKGAILANMSHEFRTPLTAILGFSDILREEVSSELYEFADAIQDGGRRLLSTLNDLMDLSRLDADDEDLPVRAIEVMDVINASLADVAEEAAEKGIVIDLKNEAPSVQAVLSETGLRRILDALLGNAVKFTDKGGVQVLVHAADSFFAIRVRDTGVGIGADFLPELYEPFKQESDGHSRSFEGTGLGLAITQRYVKRMGGEIRVMSKKGQGTLFEVAFPRVAPGWHPSRAARPSALPVGDARGNAGGDSAPASHAQPPVLAADS